jgi:hypothetical protein
MQHKLVSRLNELTLGELYTNVVGINHQTRLHSVSSQGALDFLRALPSDQATCISDPVFTLRLCRILGVSPNINFPEKCACGAVVNQEDRSCTSHFLGCESFRIRVHDEIVHEFRNGIRAAGMRCEKELPGSVVFPGRATDKNMRVDLFSTSSLDSQSIVGDVTIRNPHSPSSSAGVSSDAITNAEKDKNKKYSALCKDAGHKFEVYAFDHYGKSSSDVEKLFNRLKKHSHTFGNIDILDRLMWSAPSFVTHLRQRLSCKLQFWLGMKELLTLQRSLSVHNISQIDTLMDIRRIYRRSYLPSASRSGTHGFESRPVLTQANIVQEELSSEAD